MAPGEVVNNILTALLTVAFVYTVISSFIKLSKDEIGSKNFESTKLFPHQFPSLVICPWVYGSNVPKINALNNDFTLEDIEKLPRIQDVMTVKVRMSESYTKNMRTMMIDSNDSWTEFVWVLPLEGNDIVRCAEIAIPSDNTATEDVSIILTMDSSVIENAQMEFKYQGKTHNNFQPDFRNALAFREGGIFHLETFVNKKIRNCDMENKQRPFDCIQGFLSSKINCSTLWEKNSTKPLCQSVDAYKTYFDHYLNILKMDYEDQLDTFECLKIDCHDFYWKAKQIDTFPDYIPGIKTVIVSILTKSVGISEEYELYNILSFWAEVGGFLGLLLGASILSVTVGIFEVAMKFMAKRTKKCCSVVV